MGINKTDCGAASVSVVIPCHNSEATLTETIDSVLAQTLMPKEIILVDDCSVDSTMDIINSYTNNEKITIRYHRMLKNVGAASARNQGWKMAAYEYVAFLDSDDIWHPQKLELQYSYMINNPDVVLCGHTVEVIDHDCQRNYFEKKFGSLKEKRIDFSRLLFSNKFLTPTVILKRNIGQRFENNKRYSEDFLLWCEIAYMHKECYMLINAPLAALKKDFYGASGLSGDLWKLEKGELETYRTLYKKGMIGLFRVLFFSFFSYIKYLRRLILVYLKK